MLRTSERGTFKRCRWKWWMEFEELIKPNTDTPPLRFGSLVHKALAAYYRPGLKRGPHPAKTFAKEYAREAQEQADIWGMRIPDVEGDDTWVKAAELGEAMMNHYIDRYGKDQRYEVICTEQTFRTIVYKPWTWDPNHPIEAQDPEPWFWYVGILDGIWRDREAKRPTYFIVDHKTTRAIQTKYLALDDQATAYWTWGLDWVYANKLIPARVRPSGMIFNFMRKAMPDDRPRNPEGHFLNQDGSVSKRQPPEFFKRVPVWRDFTERESARARVIEEFLDIENIRKERAGYYKNPGQMTCPGCWAFDICELHEVGADWETVRDATTRQWEPYAEHEIYAGDTRDS